MNEIEYKKGRYTIVIRKRSEEINSNSINRLYLKGKVVAITGRGPLSRAELFKISRNKGCIIDTNTVTKRTDLLVVGDKPGSKLNKAKILGIQLIDINEFIKILRSDNDSD